MANGVAVRQRVAEGANNQSQNNTDTVAVGLSYHPTDDRSRHLYLKTDGPDSSDSSLWRVPVGGGEEKSGT